MNRLLINGALLALGLSVNGVAQAAGDVANGQAEFKVCGVCHGENGEGTEVLGAPRIAGQEEWYVARQLNNFRKSLRAPDDSDVHGTQMRAMALALDSEQAVEDVAAYVATLSAPAPAATVVGDAAKGKTNYATCVACHGADGKGNEALNSPSLAAQNDWYTVRQLQNYKKRIRGANPQNLYDTQMSPMAAVLIDDAAINDVVAYINSLE